MDAIAMRPYVCFAVREDLQPRDGKYPEIMDDLEILTGKLEETWAMFERLRRLWPKQESVRECVVPIGRRVYVIGDIHGCRDELERLHDRLAADWELASAKGCTIVYLGDYIDRGPDSRGVIGTLLGPSPIAGAERIFITGNHEQAMLDFLQAPESNPHWLDFGGMETLASYGVRRSAVGSRGRQELAERMAEAMPESHRVFFESLAPYHRIGDYFFVHAGVRPGVSLDRQVPDDCCWIRGAFLESRQWHGAMIVHGHTVTDQPDERANRIGIDTGAYASGVLTALRLEGNQRSFFQTGLSR
ncbi:metallophosphoesterase [Lacibacterium aquatile]|uniref:Metallophosphoesterase n=1 Tax=Lacibacterium aquatile TaxID=1168082 RepID=A0ABW5DW66_9PROT